MSEILCPKCGSNQITANKKGFSGKKAVVGAVITGGIGLLAGTIGSNKVKITCLSCGHVFKPGQGVKSQEEFKKKNANAGCMVIVLLFFAIGMFIKCGSSSNQETKSEYQRIYDSISQDDPEIMNSVSVINTIEKEFIIKKAKQYKTLINSDKSTDEIKIEANQLTKSLLNEQNNEIKNWEGEIAWVDMCKGTNLDISIIIQNSIVVGQKIISDNNEDCSIEIDAGQGDAKKYGYVGIARSGELYNKIKKLKEGDKVIFSAKIVDAMDNAPPSGTPFSVMLEINLTDIQKK